jgi:hypothetical protein
MTPEEMVTVAKVLEDVEATHKEIELNPDWAKGWIEVDRVCCFNPALHGETK